MDLRRALLLFAIVLGVAAVVAAVANPPARQDERSAEPAPPTTRSTEPSRPPVTVRLDGGGAPREQPLEIGRATTLVVVVDEPGTVELSGFGLTDSAEPREPAVFDLLPASRGRNEVRFTPAGGVRTRALGELVSRPAK